MYRVSYLIPKGLRSRLGYTCSSAAALQKTLLDGLASCDDVTVMVIEQMCLADSIHRKPRESYWIYTLRSVALHRLNLDP